MVTLRDIARRAWVAPVLSMALIASQLTPVCAQTITSTSSATAAPATTPAPLEGEILLIDEFKKLFEPSTRIVLNGTKLEPKLSLDGIFIDKAPMAVYVTSNADLFAQAASARFIFHALKTANDTVDTYNDSFHRPRIATVSTAAPAAVATPTTLTSFVSQLSGQLSSIGVLLQLFYNQTALTQYRLQLTDAEVFTVLSSSAYGPSVKWMGHTFILPDNDPNKIDTLHYEASRSFTEPQPVSNPTADQTAAYEKAEAAYQEAGVLKAFLAAPAPTPIPSTPTNPPVPDPPKKSNMDTLEPNLITEANANLCLLSVLGGTNVRSQANLFTGGHLTFATTMLLQIVSYKDGATLPTTMVLSTMGPYTDTNPSTLGHLIGPSSPPVLLGPSGGSPTP